MIHFPRDANGRCAELPTLQQVVGDGPLAWIDDELTPAAFAWAAARPSPTLLLPSAPAVGLTSALLDRLWDFASSLAP